MTHDDEQSHIDRAAAALGDPDVRRDAHQDHAPDRIWLRYDGAIVASDYPRPWETNPYVRADLIRAVDREALVEVILTGMNDWSNDGSETSEPQYAIADALLAAGLRLPGGGARNRVEYDEAGKLDEVVTDAGMHLERMSDKGWFLSGQRSDGSEIAIWFKGKVALVEERPAP